MYSVRHVLWRGAMALTLLVVGGVGAGVSAPAENQAAEECAEALPILQGARVMPDDGRKMTVVRAEPRSRQPDEA
jgi:hypothetical protein